MISGNTANNNMGGIVLNASEHNSIVGNTVSNNEIGIYLILSCYNNLDGNILMNNTVADYYKIPDSYCEEPEDITTLNLFFLLGIFIVFLSFLGISSIVSITRSKEPYEGKRKMESISKIQKHPRSKPEIKTKPLNINQEKVLQGKTLQVYWYILTHNRAGVREIQKSLNFSSPGTVSYQINKLLEAGIISKDDKSGKYHVNEELKKGILGFYTHIGFLMIPRFSLYLIINVLGFIGYIIFASIYGDKFITNPGSILLLIFLIFGTAIFIFESIKVWRTRPTKLK
jgi:parallel beta-helix repeat protein